VRTMQAPRTLREPWWGGCRTLWRDRRSGFAAGALGVAVGLLSGCSEEADTIFVPTAYVVAGRVADPTENPIAGIPGARVLVETASQVVAVTSDANGDFILQGVPPGVHRLRVEQVGRVTTVTYDFMVGNNVADAFVPLFTPAQIDSVLAARSAPAWNRSEGLFGLFALKSTGVPLGDAVATFAPSPGGTLVQTGEGADPIVVVNGSTGTFNLSVTRAGYVWDGPYAVSLRPNILTFAAPRARPNFNGFVLADVASGAPVSGATVTALFGPTTEVSSTTNFLGQFSIVGLLRGTYAVSVEAAGYLPTLSLPQPLDQDTTLAAIVHSADSLAAWAAAGGQAPPDPARGVVALEVREMGTGVLVENALVRVDGVPDPRGTPQTTRAPALAFDVPAGMHRLIVLPGGPIPQVEIDSVHVRNGTVTSGRIDVSTTVPLPARRAQRR
jgi:hypothetical protein